jgi:hypothetical protein
MFFGSAVCIGERKGAYLVLSWNPEGNIPLVRPGYRYADNIELYLKRRGIGGRELH